MKKMLNPDSINIEELILNEDLYNQVVYTPIPQALKEIDSRWKDTDLKKDVEKYLKGDLPKPLGKKIKAVLFRQVVSPNNETRRFLEISQKMGIEPMLLEYLEDKFTTNNPIKRALGKMRFLKIVGKKHSIRYEYKTIIDFNKNCGKKMKKITTLWGEPLVDIHHQLLKMAFPEKEKYLFDGSKWFSKGGKGAKEYYSKYLSLFIRNAVLFENFIPRDEERDFVKNVFLPSFINIWKRFGRKPIIVALLPQDNPNDIFWDSYPIENLSFINNKS